MQSCDIHKLAKSYNDYLQSLDSGLCNAYKKRLRESKDAALAEAVVYNFLKGYGLETSIHEDSSTGGLDFSCKKEAEEFLIEVTSIGDDAVSRRTGLPNNLVADEGFSFNLLTQSIHQKIKDKVKQSSNHPVPRVLVIVVQHWAKHFLLDVTEVERILTGDTEIQINFGSSATKEVAPLKNSSFIRLNKRGDALESCRKSISAVLVVSASESDCSVLGCLHPDPAYVFSHSIFSNIPFARLKNWSPKANKLEVEWVVHRPTAPVDYYFTVGCEKSK